MTNILTLKLRFQKVLIGIIGLSVGLVVALLSFHEELKVDYDSGAEMRTWRVCEICVREEVPKDAWFGQVPLGNGKYGLSGKPNWHTVAIFYGNSHLSASFAGSGVFKQIRRIEMVLRDTESRQISQLKESYLSILSAQGEIAAGSFVDKIELPRRENQ